jgi:hypothetical protein
MFFKILAKEPIPSPTNHPLTQTTLGYLKPFIPRLNSQLRQTSKMKLFQLQDNGLVQTKMSARDKMFFGQPSQMTSSGGSSSVIGPNSVPSSSNSSSASGVHPSSLLVHHLPMFGHPSMMPYMRPIFHAPMVSSVLWLCVLVVVTHCISGLRQRCSSLLRHGGSGSNGHRQPLGVHQPSLSSVGVYIVSSLVLAQSLLLFSRIVKAQLAHQYPMGRSTSSYKTVMCQSWLETATCKFGEECKFAHGEYELRESM